MKKLAIAAAAAAALTAGVSHAYTIGTFSNGFVVPNVIHNGAGDTTAVGVLRAGTGGESGAVAVHWVFYNQNSVHERDGCFVMTNNDFAPFVWASPLNGSGTKDVSDLAGKRGYLVFAVGDTSASGASAKTACEPYNLVLPSNTSSGVAAEQIIAGAAFHVNTATSDVAYVPVIDGPIAGTSDNFALSELDPVTAVAGLQDANKTHYMRFFVEGGAKTDLVIWSLGDQTALNKVVVAYDDKQNNLGSSSLPLTNKELNVIPVTSVLTGGAKDGFLKWNTSSNEGVFTYSVVNAPAFGAIQTIVNPYTR